MITLKLFEIVHDKNIGPVFYVNFLKRKIGFCFCHRIKDRSIWFFGLERYLCSRCLGILIGSLIGLLLVRVQYNAGLIFSVFLILPLVVDGITQGLRYRISNNFLRCATGFMFGIGLQFFVAISIELF